MSGFERWLKRIYPLWARACRTLVLPIRVARLQAFEYWRRTLLVAPDAGVIVTLTSHGARLRTAHLAVLSIGTGKQKPGRLILWLEPEDYERRGRCLRALERRGVEIKVAEGFGPHTKYLAALPEAVRSGHPFITADDDVLYPRYWLRQLTRAHWAEPDVVHAHRCRQLELDGMGRPRPYGTWQPVYGRRAGLLNVALGVSGVCYPASFAAHLLDRGSEFLACAPRADDLWLHSNAVRQRLQTRQISYFPRQFPTIPATQTLALKHSNVDEHANDKQALATYTQEVAIVLKPRVALEAAVEARASARVFPFEVTSTRGHLIRPSEDTEID
jgi:hypothetical protein